MVEINGRKVPWEEGLTVDKLLNRVDYSYPMIIVRVNGTLVAKEEWPCHHVPDGAVVDAHHLIAGG